jgi:ribonuclease HII
VRSPSNGPPPNLKLERALQEQGHRVIAGVDEVGRGSWAGPLVAAAVVLPLHLPKVRHFLRGVRDSKQLSAEEREHVLKRILRVSSAIGIGWCTHHVIDTEGLTIANRRAMERAIAGLKIRPDCLLIDHLALPNCGLPQTCIAKGDSRSVSIASASIVAKVIRDRWMTKYEARLPGYGFGQHKGYGTKEHRLALLERGPSPIHRTSWRPFVAAESLGIDTPEQLALSYAE